MPHLDEIHDDSSTPPLCPEIQEINQADFLLQKKVKMVFYLDKIKIYRLSFEHKADLLDLNSPTELQVYWNKKRLYSFQIQAKEWLRKRFYLNTKVDFNKLEFMLSNSLQGEQVWIQNLSLTEYCGCPKN